MKVYNAGVALFAVVFIALGVTMLALTAARGGGVGFLFGALFCALGAGRLYLLLPPDRCRWKSERGRRGK